VTQAVVSCFGGTYAQKPVSCDEVGVASKLEQQPVDFENLQLFYLPSQCEIVTCPDV